MYPASWLPLAGDSSHNLAFAFSCLSVHLELKFKDTKPTHPILFFISVQVPWINAQMFHVQLDREFDLAILEGKQLEIKRKEEEERRRQAKFELETFVDDRSEKSRNGFRDRLLHMFFGKDRR